MWTALVRAASAASDVRRDRRRRPVGDRPLPAAAGGDAARLLRLRADRLDDARARPGPHDLGARRRRARAVYGVYSYASVLSLSYVESELGFRDNGHTSLAAILAKPQVKRDLRCGPVSVPNHKLIPDTRWLLDRGASGVIARSQADHDPRLEARIQHGVALYALGLAQTATRSSSRPTTRSTRCRCAASRGSRAPSYYAAYARCPA
jgi:hypothetical protein